jgi:hypothetical protein
MPSVPTVALGRELMKSPCRPMGAHAKPAATFRAGDQQGQSVISRARSVNRELEARARVRAGIKGYVTNLGSIP